MSKIVCEVCGGELLKTEDVFICQNCGCKYSIEEVRKMMATNNISSVNSQATTDNVESAGKHNKHVEDKSKKIKKIIKIAIPIICVCIAFVIFLTTVIIPNRKYNAAMTLYKSNNVIEAYEALVALNGYKDSAEKASYIFDEYKNEKLKIAKVGDYVLFGSYEQDNDTSNGKENIEWIVLSKEYNNMLLISKKALDCKKFANPSSNVTWERSLLRTWLNGPFVYEAFSSFEEEKIQNTSISVDEGCAGNVTSDEIFLLSVSEIEKYFGNNEARQCVPTDYAKSNDSLTFNSSSYTRDGEATCCWWLRTPGSRGCAIRINGNGTIDSSGEYVSLEYYVRPALWISLDT